MPEDAAEQIARLVDEGPLTGLSWTSAEAVVALVESWRGPTIGYFIHRPDEHGNAPQLTCRFGYAIARVYPSRAAARGAFGPTCGDEKLYRVIEDTL